MTIRELLELLNTVENKDVPVQFYIDNISEDDTSATGSTNIHLTHGQNVIEICSSVDNPSFYI